MTCLMEDKIICLIRPVAVSGSPFVGCILILEGYGLSYEELANHSGIGWVCMGNERPLIVRC